MNRMSMSGATLSVFFEGTSVQVDGGWGNIYQQKVTYVKGTFIHGHSHCHGRSARLATAVALLGILRSARQLQNRKPTNLEEIEKL